MEITSNDIKDNSVRMIFDRGVARLRGQADHHIFMVVTDFSLMAVNHQNELECNQINKNYI